MVATSSGRGGLAWLEWLMRNDQTLRGLGALIVEKFAAEGCNVAINYNASADRAKLVAEKVMKDYKAKALVIKGV